jgi:hypothetical protein
VPRSGGMQGRADGLEVFEVAQGQDDPRAGASR